VLEIRKIGVVGLGASAGRLIGIDVHVHASEALRQSLGEPRMAPPPRLAEMAKAGLLGRKSGHGFYSYT